MKNVRIPKSPLRAQLDEAEALKHEMAAMLHELEERTPKPPGAKPGSWRHHPADWARTGRDHPGSQAAPRR